MNIWNIDERTTMHNCDGCDDCCYEPCLNEIKCVYSPIDSCCCWTIPIRVAPDRSIPAGTLMAQRQTDGFWDAYDPQATNGLQYPRGVLRYDAITDEKGRLTNWRNYMNINCGQYITNVYVAGTFRLEETIGNLTAALSNEAFGRVIEGFVGGAGVWKLL